MPQNTASQNPKTTLQGGGQEAHGFAEGLGASRELGSTEGSCPMSGNPLQKLLGGQEVNVGDVERVVSVMGGGLLTLFGATRGGLTGLGLAVLGGGLIYRGVTGHCEAYHGLGIDTTDSGGSGSKHGRQGGRAPA